MYKDVKDKIKNLSETTPTLDWKKSKFRLVSTMSTLESMLVILAKTMIATPTKREKDKILNILQGWELPTVIGTMILEF